jgi:ribosomal protein S14
MGYGKNFCQLCDKGYAKGRDKIVLDDGTELCRVCFDKAYDDGNIEICNTCNAEGYDPDFQDHHVVNDCEVVCASCFREMALAGKIQPFLPLEQALAPEQAKHAPSLEFTGIITNGWALRSGTAPAPTYATLPEGNDIVDQGFFDSMKGTRNGEYGTFEGGLADIVAEVKEDHTDWAEGEYLLVLDRASCNVCALTYYVLRRKAQVLAEVA